MAGLASPHGDTPRACLIKAYVPRPRARASSRFLPSFAIGFRERPLFASISRAGKIWWETMFGQRIKQVTLAALFALALPASMAFANSAAQTVDDARAAMISAIKAEDADAIDAFISAETTLLPEYQKALIGGDNTRAYYDAFAARFEVERLKKKSREVIKVGTKHVDIGTFELSLRHEQTDAAHKLKGSYFDVWDLSDKNAPKLATQAWNYDESYENVRALTEFKSLNGTHYAFTPHAPLVDDISFDLALLTDFNDSAMMRREHGVLYHAYAKDAIMAPHDTPYVEGKEAIEEFLKGYSAGWPLFDYVSSQSHFIEGGENYALEQFSYNLRWNAAPHSGIAIGKGVRILKRDDHGSWRIFRVISMHD